MFFKTKGFNARFRMGHMDQDQGSPSFPSISMTQHPILTDPWSRVAVLVVWNLRSRQVLAGLVWPKMPTRTAKCSASAQQKVDREVNVDTLFPEECGVLINQTRDGSMVLLYMVTFTINIPQMLAYIPAPWILWENLWQTWQFHMISSTNVKTRMKSARI